MLLTKYLKKFCLKIFIFFRRCRWHRWQTFIRDYLREFSKKFETIPIGYSEAWGTLIYEKNLKSKISCQTPFKQDGPFTEGLQLVDLTALASSVPITWLLQLCLRHKQTKLRSMPIWNPVSEYQSTETQKLFTQPASCRKVCYKIYQQRLK